jgi:hypothetical protein
LTRRNTSPVDAASWLLAIIVLAVAIPANDKIGKNGVFFAAHGVSPLAWVVLLIVGLAVVWAVLAGLLTLIQRKASARAFDLTASILTALVALFFVGNALALAVFSGAPWAAIVVGAVVALAIVLAARQLRMGSVLLVFAGIAAAIPIVGSVLTGSQGEATTAFAFSAESSKPNVVWVISDELQYPLVFDQEGRARDEFPNLQALQQTSTTYTHAYTAANYTDTAVPAMLTGIADVSAQSPQRMQQVRSNIGIIPGFSSDYQIVTESPIYRYECDATECASVGAASESNPVVRYWNFAKDSAAIAGRTVLASPFSDIFPSLDGKWRDYWASGDEFGSESQGASVDKVLSGINAATESAPGTPFFAFWHTIRTHAPWNIDREGKTIFPFRVPIVDGAHMFGSQANQTYSTEDLKSVERRLYANTAVEFDRELGALVASLKAAGTFDDTMIIVTADHGAALTDRSDRRVGDDLVQRWSEVAHVPLVVKSAGQASPEIVAAPRSTGQIARTVTAATGAQVPDELPLAPDLSDDLPKGPVFGTIADGRATPYVYQGVAEVDPWTPENLTPPDPAHPFAIGIDLGLLGKPVPSGYTELVNPSVQLLNGDSDQQALVVTGASCPDTTAPALVTSGDVVTGSLLWQKDATRGWAIAPKAEDYGFWCPAP